VARHTAASCCLVRCSCGSSRLRGARCWEGDTLAARRGAGSLRPAAGSWREVRRGHLWIRQRKVDWHLFGMHLSSASSLELCWEAVGRGRCPSQKGSGAEAVCLECASRSAAKSGKSSRTLHLQVERQVPGSGDGEWAGFLDGAEVRGGEGISFSCEVIVCFRVKMLCSMWYLN
jgi:hypothetical protein